MSDSTSSMARLGHWLGALPDRAPIRPVPLAAAGRCWLVTMLPFVAIGAAFGPIGATWGAILATLVLISVLGRLANESQARHARWAAIGGVFVACFGLLLFRSHAAPGWPQFGVTIAVLHIGLAAFVAITYAPTRGA